MPPPSDLPLRVACIHGRYEGHKASFIPSEPPEYNRGGARKGQNVMCPGGREVTVDRRAAQVAVAEGILDRIAGGDDWEDWADEALQLVDLCLAAAIGDTG